MCEQEKNDEKGYFIYLALSSFRVGKMLFFEGKGYVFDRFSKGCKSKRVCVLIYYIGKGYFLTGHSEKGYQFQNMYCSGYVLRSLFTHRYTVEQQAPPPR